MTVVSSRFERYADHGARLFVDALEVIRVVIEALLHDGFAGAVDESGVGRAARQRVLGGHGGLIIYANAAR